jgi:hypothetical protein
MANRAKMETEATYMWRQAGGTAYIREERDSWGD